MTILGLLERIWRRRVPAPLLSGYRVVISGAYPAELEDLYRSLKDTASEIVRQLGGEVAELPEEPGWQLLLLLSEWQGVWIKDGTPLRNKIQLRVCLVRRRGDARDTQMDCYFPELLPEQTPVLVDCLRQNLPEALSKTLAAA